MEPRYRTPEELVEGLHARGPGARAQTWQLLRAPLDRLIGELIARHGLDEDRDLLTTHALHSAETALRTRSASTFAGLSWGAFRSAVLVQMARLILQPHGAARADPFPSLGLPESPAYHSQTFFRPYARLGNSFFGGDWYVGRCLDDGSLWVLLADVTGHGYYAYLLASGLPSVWQRCWNAQGDQPPEPADLLACMHELLRDCLPEGIYLECTLVRLEPDGKTTVVPAGGTRLFLAAVSQHPVLVKLRGAWLGLRAPSSEEQHTLSLNHGDELLLATDGVFDQLDPNAIDALVRRHPRGTLFEVLRDMLERSLASEPQKDDITLVLLRRRSDDRGSRIEDRGSTESAASAPGTSDRSEHDPRSSILDPRSSTLSNGTGNVPM
jgi:sulfur transfer complex TusBCD TusB component (DsrH family)